MLLHPLPLHGRSHSVYSHHVSTQSSQGTVLRNLSLRRFFTLCGWSGQVSPLRPLSLQWPSRPPTHRGLQHKPKACVGRGCPWQMWFAVCGWGGGKRPVMTSRWRFLDHTLACFLLPIKLVNMFNKVSETKFIFQFIEILSLLNLSQHLAL
jgi:hypothetical protein